MPPRTVIVALLALSFAATFLLAEPATSWDQVVATLPVRVRLRVVSGASDVGEPLVVRVEATVPSLSLDESLATGQPARFRPEPQLSEWLRIPHLILKHIDRGEESRPQEGVTLFHWTYRWEAELPGSYTLPALRLAFRPVKPETKALETVFAGVPVTVGSLMADNPAAEPRPAVTRLPRSPQPALRWVLVVLAVLLWAAVRFGYARWQGARRQAASGFTRCPPRIAAFQRLRESRGCLDAYQILRRFLLDAAGIDLAKATPEDLRAHPRLSESARRILPALVEKLQPGAYSHGDAPLPPELRDCLQEFLSSFET